MGQWVKDIMTITIMRKHTRSIAKEQNVSDTDTSEEEKANAKKLHAVKMLEKYYIYLSEEETGILERMLEDCKRRKPH